MRIAHLHDVVIQLLLEGQAVLTGTLEPITIREDAIKQEGTRPKTQDAAYMQIRALDQNL